jgi:dephospho-CoA kinase
MSLTVGITGGIGSGKTAVSDRFKKLGITVVDADVVAREVVEPGTHALVAIEDHFGAAVIGMDGCLDRAYLRSQVFADDDERNWLNGLLHPLIGERIMTQIQNSESPYTVLVSPLLIETAQRNLCDRILVVDVTEEAQVERASARDNNDPEQIRKIMATQTGRKERLEHADDVLVNSGTLEDLDQQVTRLHQQYLALADTESTHG